MGWIEGNKTFYGFIVLIFSNQTKKNSTHTESAGMETIKSLYLLWVLCGVKLSVYNKTYNMAMSGCK